MAEILEIEFAIMCGLAILILVVILIGLIRSLFW